MMIALVAVLVHLLLDLIKHQCTSRFRGTFPDLGSNAPTKGVSAKAVTLKDYKPDTSPKHVLLSDDNGNLELYSLKHILDAINEAETNAKNWSKSHTNKEILKLKNSVNGHITTLKMNVATKQPMGNYLYRDREYNLHASDFGNRVLGTNGCDLHGGHGDYVAWCDKGHGQHTKIKIK